MEFSSVFLCIEFLTVLIPVADATGRHLGLGIVSEHIGHYVLSPLCFLYG
jgi:hypothetical protein